MSDIMVKIGSIQGESTLKSGALNFEKQIECDSMRHAIQLPVVAQGSARLEGASHHGAIELSHSIDAASPGLRYAASAGQNLGTVTITRLRTIAGELKEAEIINLGNAYVVRVDADFPVDSQTNVPMEDPVETFHLEYSEIKWEYKTYSVDGKAGGTVTGSFSTATQAKTVQV